VALTDGNGNITDRIEYSLYGLITCRAGQTDTPFLFIGRSGVMTDPNGLLYMRARYYNPYLCRFLNADPAGFSGGLNLYAYANGNPVSLSDPSGLGAVGSSVPNWLTPSSGSVDMSQIFSWLGGGGTLPYSVSFPFGDMASLLLPGYSSLSTANAAFMAGDYGLATVYGVKGVGEAGLFLATLGGSEGLNMELNAAQGGVMATREGLIDVSQHLSTFGADPPNSAMYSRLTTAFENGRALTGTDAAFYQHELIESSLMDAGMADRAAHLETLSRQGIPYAPGHESQLYHPTVIQQFPGYFNPAAHP
jgi:RHS repeat-associated protein